MGMGKLDKIQLGKVKSIFFGREGHGILSFMIDIDFGGTGQGFGGYCLDTYCKEKNRRMGHASGTDLVLRLLDLFAVDELNSIVGRYVYALRDNDSWNSRIIGLRMPEVDDSREFLIKDWQKEWFPEK